MGHFYLIFPQNLFWSANTWSSLETAKLNLGHIFLHLNIYIKHI